MIYKTFDRFGDGSVILTCYILDVASPEFANKERDAVLVCPGGGYTFVSPREKEPVALAFANAGYHAFTLVYSVTDRPLKLKPLQDLSWAISIIRAHAKEWLLNPDHIAVCGFSAGGHLTASLGTLWNRKEVYEPIGLLEGENKPNALIACYPVINLDEFVHQGSLDSLLGDDYIEEGLHTLLSPEKNVGSHTPPSFIWHTFPDKTVPVENALLFADALRKQDIPFELHIFPEGNHGYSLANEFTQNAGCPPDTHIAKWMDLCLDWLKVVFR